MPTIYVTDLSGEVHQVEAQENVPLMETLRDLPFGVEAICGGLCSCATCHCYVGEEWLAKLPAKQDDEAELLEELEHVKPTSRLTCQLEMTESLAGLQVIIAPFE